MFQSAHNSAGQAGSLISTGVIIAPHATGEMIKVSKADSTNGSIMLTETSSGMNARGYIEETKKVAFMRGSVAQLTQILGMYSGKTLPGRLRVEEYLEGSVEVAERIAGDLKYFKQDYTKALGKKVKTNPRTGAFLTKDGKRIIRFVTYDMGGQSGDVLIEHDKTPVAPSGAQASAPAPSNVAPVPELPQGKDSDAPF